jgi:hypothetical protein
MSSKKHLPALAIVINLINVVKHGISWYLIGFWSQLAMLFQKQVYPMHSLM